MYLFFIFLPLIGFVYTALFSFLISRFWVMVFILCCSSFCCFLSWFLFFDNIILAKIPCEVFITTYPWMVLELLDISWSFCFDNITLSILLIITTISTLVHIYSIEYMCADPHIVRFMSYLSLFTFFMLILVTSDNLIQMFLGWEGVGLCSYFLINFWFTRIQANKAAIKAMLINRIGDFGLTLGILLVFFETCSLNYTVIFSQVPFYYSSPFLLDLIAFFIIIGVMGKSAQLGLHTWLPDAMEGPTPVSALIHAATMVTAGVFLIIKCSPLFEFSTWSLCFLCFLGASTLFFSGTIGLFQTDVKRVIAYSTCSQLGYMVLACGLSSYNFSLFHLVNHAFFKALLFLSAGALIHGSSDEQSMFRLGGLMSALPLTYTAFLIGTLSLMGVPFLTGFYSKEPIILLAFVKYYSFISQFGAWFAFITAILTTSYSLRTLSLVFGESFSFISYHKFVHEVPFFMLLPLVFLSFGSIFFGFVMKDLFIIEGARICYNGIFIHPEHCYFFEHECLPFFLKTLPFIGTYFGWVVSLGIYSRSPYFFYDFSCLNFFIFDFCNSRWHFDRSFNLYGSFSSFDHSFQGIYKILDKGLLELIGPTGFSFFCTDYSIFLGRLQTGFIFHYLFVLINILIMLVSLLFFMFFGVALDFRWFLVLVLVFCY